KAEIVYSQAAVLVVHGLLTILGMDGASPFLVGHLYSFIEGMTGAAPPAFGFNGEVVVAHPKLSKVLTSAPRVREVSESPVTAVPATADGSELPSADGDGRTSVLDPSLEDALALYGAALGDVIADLRSEAPPTQASAGRTPANADPRSALAGLRQDLKAHANTFQAIAHAERDPEIQGLLRQLEEALEYAAAGDAQGEVDPTAAAPRPERPASEEQTPEVARVPTGNPSSAIAGAPGSESTLAARKAVAAAVATTLLLIILGMATSRRRLEEPEEGDDADDDAVDWNRPVFRPPPPRPGPT
ncbi:MAG TPA: hypothetical protein VEY30_00970, partial [Myxococcaceae bacterium]|nr:hypothetical protein [Myxococcaceae bacterium]